MICCVNSAGLRWRRADEETPTNGKPETRRQWAVELCRSRGMTYNRVVAIWGNAKDTQHAEAEKRIYSSRGGEDSAVNCRDWGD